MEAINTQPDYRGSRGSTTGDEFQELWAVRQALRLLDAASDLTAITVDGVPATTGRGPEWDGVDCTLLFGGRSLKEANRVEVQQLKYSAANPDKRWIVSRVCKGRGGKPETSLIRRLADAFKALEKERKDKSLDTIKISLVTNQSVSPELIEIFEKAQAGVPNKFALPWQKEDPKLHRLVAASGLSAAQFKRFAKVVDFQGETGSRFSIEAEMLAEIAKWADTEFREMANRLRRYIRNQRFPDRAGELITKEDVLFQFGVYDEDVLFPCRSGIQSVECPVPRNAAQVVVDAITQGSQRICFHGAGGVGKTTALQEVASLLPDESEMIIFDCYGAGSYLDASVLRHRPRDAFMQLSNELAQRLRLPMLLESNSTRNFARTFRKRLNFAAETFKSIHPEGFLVIAVDAADNSITAAESRDDTSFVTEIMSFSSLPPNVCIIVSARTGRLDALKPPREFKKIELPAFTQEETATNIQRYWEAPRTWIEDFHHFSGGNPRVQAYAFEHAGEVCRNALTALQPGGIYLDQLFDERFQFALTKSGRTDLIEKICAGLTVLPRPIPVAELAHVLNLSEPQVIDICTDLAPGVRRDSDLISLSDEDFEDYLRRKGSSVEQEILHKAAKRFLKNADSDRYAALNVAPLLFFAGRKGDLLNFVEREPEPKAAVVPDPVRRREIHDQRLLYAIKVCRKAGDTARALRFVLLGAEAIGTKKATKSLLVAFPRLTAKYAKDTASRLILGVPEHIEDHGPLLYHLLAEDADKGDAIGFREGRRRLRAWLRARRDNYEIQRRESHHGRAWTINPDDVAANLFATAVMNGAEAAIDHFSRIRTFRFAIAAGKAFVDKLLVEKRFELAEEIAETCPVWQAVFLIVPLACAGREIDLDRLNSGLAVLKRRFPLDAEILKWDRQNNDTGSYVTDTVLSAVEILVGRGMRTDICTEILSPFLDGDLRRIDRRHDFETSLLDAILRAYCLSKAINGKSITESEVLTDRAEPEDEASRGTPRRDEKNRDRSLRDVINTITPIYAERAKIIVGQNTSRVANFEELGKALDRETWQFDRSHWASNIRARIAEGLTVLIAVGGQAREVMTHAFDFRRGLWPRGNHGARELCTRFTMIPELHADLHEKIIGAVSETRRKRIGAEDKSRTLAAFAELLIPISPDDAGPVFQYAEAAAAELDFEAVSQFKFLSSLIEHAETAFSMERRSDASAVAEIVNDAAIRLEGMENFPVDEAMSAIAHLDIPTALAAAARWDDSGVANLGVTLPPVLSLALKTGYLNSVQTAALLCLHDETPAELLQSVMKQAVQEGNDMASSIAEEFSRDSLISRLPWYDGLEPLIAQHGQGEWVKRFKERYEFTKALSDENSTEDTYTSESSNERSDVTDYLDTHDWSEEVLTDAEKLLNEATDILARSKEAGEHRSLDEILERAGKAVLPRFRTSHLNALADILARTQNDWIVNVILNTARCWNSQPAISQWCREELPPLLAKHLPSFVRDLPWTNRRLAQVIELSGLSEDDTQRALLGGIERNVDWLDPRVIFALAGDIGLKLAPEDATDLCKWYIKHLLERIPETDRESINTENIPDMAPEAVGRFLYAYMSDVDLRLRWRAAHALRRLVRLGEGSALDATIKLYNRIEEQAFRAKNTPFYWPAARLWLVIALDRISEETPTAVARYGETLLEICFSEDFPHLLVRDYAADACRKLIANGQLQPDSTQIEQLEQVNKGLPPAGTGKRVPHDAFEFGEMRSSGLRFHFDAMDTLRYWYKPWLYVFEDLTSNTFLETVEEWIVDKWGVEDHPPYGSEEPRTQRFSDPPFNLSSNSHGSLPTLEGYRNHLEWHAMWCAAGQLLKTHPLRNPEDSDSNELANRISQYKLTHPPHWLSDFVGTVPLQPHRWRPPAKSMEDWLGGINDDDFLREVFPVDQPGWVIVSADITAKSTNHKETVRIGTGLVSPDTGHALLRALQTSKENHWYFYGLPGGEKIDLPDYTLQRWLAGYDRDRGYDGKDPYRNEIERPQSLPRQAVTDALRLQKRYGSGCVKWFRDGAEEPSFIYEAWGERGLDWKYGSYRRDRGMVMCSGYRLLVRKEDLAEFLETQGQDLIADVFIERHDTRKSEWSYDTEDSTRAAFNRLFLFRRSGNLQAAERSFEAWRENCS